MAKPAGKMRFWHSVFFIAFLALVLRLAFIPIFFSTTWNGIENHLYFGFETGRIARSIAEGRGFASPMLEQTGPTAWLTPVYPYLLAGIFKLFGVYTMTSAFVILGLNCLFSSLACFPIFYAARRSFGDGVAVAACWVWALFPYFNYIAAAFVWDTCLATLLLSLLFHWALKLREQQISPFATRHSLWHWLGFGAFWGFAVLTNASILSVFPLLSLWTLSPSWSTRSSWLKSASLVATGCAIVLLPWQVRNFRAFHAPVLLRDNFWLEFWVGNDGHTETWLDSDAHPTMNHAERAKFVEMGELPYMQEKRAQSLAFLREHPVLYVVTSARRVLYLWTGFWNMDPENLNDEFHGYANVYLTLFLTTTMLVGLAQAFRIARSTAFPYLLLLLFYPLVFYITHPTIRYRHVIDPEVVILAGLGLTSLIRPLKPHSQQPSNQD